MAMPPQPPVASAARNALMLTAAVAAFCGERVHVQGAGRTDAGVHARGQVAHLDLAKAWDADTVRDAINARLRPHPVAVLAAEPAAGDFDARFLALNRHYVYRIVNRRAVEPPVGLKRDVGWCLQADLRISGSRLRKNVLEERLFGRRGTAAADEARQGRTVGDRRRASRKQLLDLRGNDQSLQSAVVEQRLDAEPITAKDDFPGSQV